MAENARTPFHQGVPPTTRSRVSETNLELGDDPPEPVQVIETSGAESQQRLIHRHIADGRLPVIGSRVRDLPPAGASGGMRQTNLGRERRSGTW